MVVGNLIRHLPKPVKAGGIVFLLGILCFLGWTLRVDPAFHTHKPFADTKTPDVIVILIHGTFAPDANWTNQNSGLVLAIKNVFYPRVVLFQPYVWGGLLGTRYNNTNALRSAAGEKLGRLLVEFRERWPSAKIFLVAHSHGGNVALYAANRYGEKAHLSGIVCMGTPFIAVKAKALHDDPPFLLTLKITGELLFVAVVLTSSLLGIACAALAVKIGQLGCGWLRLFTFPPALAVGLISLALMTWGIAVDREHPTKQEYVPSSDTQPAHYETRINFVESEQAKELETNIKKWLTISTLKFAEHYQQKLIAQLSAFTPPSVPMFCLRSEKDEAYRGLHLEDSIAIGINGLLSSKAVSEGIMVCGGLLMFVVGIGAGGMMTFAYLKEEGFSLGNVLLSVWFGGMTGWLAGMVCGVVFCILIGVIAPLSVLARAPSSAPAMLAYGNLNIGAEYLIDTQSLPQPIDWDIDKSPTNSIKIYTFPASLKGLEHSKYYLDHDSLSDIAAWLRKQVGVD